MLDAPPPSLKLAGAGGEGRGCEFPGVQSPWFCKAKHATPESVLAQEAGCGSNLRTLGGVLRLCPREVPRTSPLLFSVM